MEDFFDDYSDYDIPHHIVCKSGWEGCFGGHEKIWQVKECFEAKRAGDFPCNWLVEFSYDDGSRGTRDCGRPARILPGDGNSFECNGGHEHISQERRIEEGWEYAEDEGEARNLVFAGVEPRTFDEGKVWPR